jgi:type IV pilus assembly protein PilB
LLSEDKLNVIRGSAGKGSLADAIVSEGYAASEGVARMLAARFHLPLVDLAVNGVNQEAANAVPLHVLERLTAIPYELTGGVLKIAIADPSDLHAIDELRLATPHQTELSVASREDILVEVKRLSRASEAFGARAVLEEEAAAFEEEEVDDLEAEDGISDAPLVRLVNSIIFQAAEDGASDVHFEPQEDSLAVRLRIDGVLHEVQRIPKRLPA